MRYFCSILRFNRLVRLALLLLLVSTEVLSADVGERYQDYVKRHPEIVDRASADASGLRRFKHTTGRVNNLVTVFDDVICEERHYPVSATEADAIVIRQGRGALTVTSKGLDETIWSTPDKVLSARFSLKGRYVQISNPREVEARLEKLRKARPAKPAEAPRDPP